MKKISRRYFLKLTGLFAGTLSLGVLPSCKNEDKEIISLGELSDYHLIKIDDDYRPVLLVKYTKQAGYLIISMLNTKNGGLIEVEIIRELSDNKEEAINNFHEQFHVTSDVLALPLFEKYYGIKETYTLDEINNLLDDQEKEIKNQKTNKKVL